MTIHALYRPNVRQCERHLTLMADIHEFGSAMRDNPSMMSGTYDGASVDEIRQELEHQFEQHDALMKSIRDGY